jgi:hypothetical protein
MYSAINRAERPVATRISATELWRACSAAICRKSFKYLRIDSSKRKGGAHMPDWLIVTLIVVTIIVVILIAMTSARNARAKKAERDRLRASEHRDSAGARAREAGEEDLRARRHAEAADRRRAEADELEQRAAEMDPDGKGTRRTTRVTPEEQRTGRGERR